MATVTPAVTYDAGNERTILWETVANGDTINSFKVPGLEGAVGSVQMTGTFGAAVTLAGSNDGTNFVTLKDTGGNDISMTAAGLADFSTAAKYIKPVEAGVTDVDVTVVLRG